MDEDQRQQLETLRHITLERLRKLEQQAAAYGLAAPPHVLTELDAARAELARIERELLQAAPAAGGLRVQPPPIPATPLIGREHELAGITALLRQPDVRLVTLSGPGGIGKTRLALQVAAEIQPDFVDGVAWIALGSIRDPELVPGTIAQALGVREVSGQPIRAQLAELLRERQLLLAIDNFEQVVDAAPVVAELLAAAPGLKVLATSRAVLRLAGEHECAVQPLALPDPSTPPSAAQLADNPAVRLFVTCARAARPAFELTDANAAAVAAICARLDGLPLAIELAAARVRLLAPQALLDRLGSRLNLLTGGARDLPTRQQTLRGAIDWSYELLGAGEQALFARLSVFAGGATLEAIEAICGPAAGEQLALSGDLLDSLSALVENSLLRQIEVPDGDMRFTMFETIREYALERLAASGALDVLRRRHAAYYLALAEQAEPKLMGAQAAPWLERIEQEHDNLRAALAWSMEAQIGEVFLRLAGALWRYWWMRGLLTEGRRWLDAALASNPEAAAADLPSRVALAQCHHGAAALAQQQGDYAHADASYAASLALLRQLGDKSGIAAVLTGQGNVALRLGDFGSARALLEESLALRRELNDTIAIAFSLRSLGSLARLQGDYAQADALYQECLSLFQQLGHQDGMASALAGLGNLALEEGDYSRAQQYHGECLSIFRELEAQSNIAIALSNLGRVAHGLGDYSQALAHFTESLAMQRSLGDRRGVAIALGYLGDTLLARNDLTGARQQYAESLAIYRDLNDRLGIADRLEGMAALGVATGNHERAARLWGAAEALRAELGTPIWPAKRADYERAVAEARAGLGEEPFAAAWAAGRELPLEQAIAEALA